MRSSRSSASMSKRNVSETGLPGSMPFMRLVILRTFAKPLALDLISIVQDLPRYAVRSQCSSSSSVSGRPCSASRAASRLLFLPRLRVSSA